MDDERECDLDDEGGPLSGPERRPSFRVMISARTMNSID